MVSIAKECVAGEQDFKYVICLWNWHKISKLKVNLENFILIIRCFEYFEIVEIVAVEFYFAQFIKMDA